MISRRRFFAAASLGLIRVLARENTSLHAEELGSEDFCWRDPYAQAEFNQLFSEYKQVLKKKGKYLDGKDNELYNSIPKGYFSCKETVDYLKKTLEREKTPEKFLEKYIEKEELRQKIREYDLYDNELEKLESIKMPWKVDIKDLSDKIYFYNSRWFLRK